MNAHCERIIGSIRREALDHVLITNEAHARHVLAAYERHYNEHRPTRPATSYHPTLTNNPPRRMTSTPQSPAHPDPRRPHQRVQICRMTCSDDFSSGTGASPTSSPTSARQRGTSTHPPDSIRSAPQASNNSTKAPSTGDAVGAGHRSWPAPRCPGGRRCRTSLRSAADTAGPRTDQLSGALHGCSGSPYASTYAIRERGGRTTRPAGWPWSQAARWRGTGRGPSGPRSSGGPAHSPGSSTRDSRPRAPQRGQGTRQWPCR